MEFYQRNLPSESNWQISIFSLSCHPVALSPDSLNHHTKQHKSCITIVMYKWVLNYLWKCDFSSDDPAVFNCLQQWPCQLNMSPHSPWCPWEPSQSSKFQKGHVLHPSSLLCESKKAPCMTTSETPAKPHVAIWSWEEVRALPSLWLKKECKPGMEFPQTLRCLFERWKGGAGWGSDKDLASALEQPFSRLCSALNPWNGWQSPWACWDCSHGYL